MNKNVLLVDDDDIFNFLSEKLIRSLGLANEVHSVLNGSEALTLFNGYFSGEIAIPDVILLDLNMPVMDGFEFIRAFQQLNFPNKEKITIVVLTSSANPADMKRARSMGINNYLVKPLTEEKIRAIFGDPADTGK